MKNTCFLLAAGLFFSTAVSAQSTVDSIASKYQLLPMPGALTLEKTFPILGSYQLTNADNTTSTVTVTLDTSNKGTVWIEGLPEGRMKAYLKKSPATYRIISQKSGSGKSIPEGTLLFDPTANTLNVALGKAFNSEDPASVFAAAPTADATASGAREVKVKTKKGVVKEKTKLMVYTATKLDPAASVTTETSPLPSGTAAQQQK